MECRTQKRNKAISNQLQTNKTTLSTRLLVNLPSHDDETSVRGRAITLYFKGFRVASSMLYRYSILTGTLLHINWNVVPAKL